MAKLTLEDFHNFYLSSFVVNNIRIMRPNEVEKLIESTESFVRKLLAVTKKAICIELGFCHKNKTNKDLIAQLFGSCSDFEHKCKADIPDDVSFALIAQIFKKGDWTSMYGGTPWAEIASSASQLESQFPITSRSLGNAMVIIDHLIDLWHNTAAYLEPYVDFNLHKFLDVKSSDYTAEDFKKADPFIKGLHQRWGKCRNVIKSGR